MLTLVQTIRAACAFAWGGSRVSRYGHNTERVLGVPSQSVALLAVLIGFTTLISRGVSGGFDRTNLR